MDEDRVLRFFAVINFRPGELKPRRLDFRRRIFDQQDGQAVGRNFVDLGHDRAKSVRIDKARIDPALAGLGGQLIDVDFARRQQHLLDAAVREVAIHVRGGKSVIGAQRLDLRDGGVVGAQVPQANIVEQRGILHGIDRRLRGGNEGKFLCVAIQAKGNGGGLDVPLDIGPLDGNFIRPHIDGVNDASGKTSLQNEKCARQW